MRRFFTPALYLALACACAPLAATVSDHVPPLINFQGTLTDTQGQGIADGHHTLGFSLYRENLGGEPIWGPTVPAQVPVTSGRFSVILGDDGASPPRSIAGALMEGPVAFLQVSVNGQSVLPRQRILSAPFAIQAAEAGHAESATRLSPQPGVAEGSTVAPDQELAILHTGLLPVAGLSVDIETTGRPVFVALNSGSVDSESSQILGRRAAQPSVSVQVQIVRRNAEGEAEETVISTQTCGYYAGGSLDRVINIPPSVFSCVDFPPAGRHTYFVKIRGRDGASDISFRSVKLVAVEF